MWVEVAALVAGSWECRRSMTSSSRTRYAEFGDLDIAYRDELRAMAVRRRP